MSGCGKSLAGIYRVMIFVVALKARLDITVFEYNLMAKVISLTG